MILERLSKVLARIFFVSIFFVLVGIFLLHYAISGQAVYGDGIGYYAHLHSWIIDNDWDYTNEYQHLYTPENNNALAPVSVDAVQIVEMSPKKVAANHFFPGTALLLLPGYVLAAAIVVVARVVGVVVSDSGYGDIFQILTGITAIAYVSAGLWLLEKCLKNLGFQKLAARIAVTAILGATPLLYYGSYDVINSHGVSFFLSCWFFYEVLVPKKRHLVLGLIAALATMARVQNIVLVLLYGLLQLEALRARKVNLKILMKQVVMFGLAYCVTLIPLIIYWSEVFGNFANHTYIQAFLNEHQTGSSSNWVGALFDERNGLFSKSPLLFGVFLSYLYLIFKEKKLLYWPLLLFFVLEFSIISLQGGWKAAAFGGRMFISSLPFFAVATAMIVQKIPRKNYLITTVAITIFILINFLQIGHFVLIGKEAEGQKAGLEQRTRTRIQRLLNSQK